jgi:Sulfotransferase domain
MIKPIILTEYPKSGGSWITSMIGGALGLFKRDIYMRPGFNLFDTTKHPWYQNGAALDFPKASVIKSHELPNSELIDFDATFVHLVRDGRDVIVSRWFFDKDFMVKNGIVSSFDKKFDDYVEEKAIEWASYVTAWSNLGFLTIRYEDFLSEPHPALGKTIKQISGVDMPSSILKHAISVNTREKFSESLSKTFQHNTFVRKGIAGIGRTTSRREILNVSTR